MRVWEEWILEVGDAQLLIKFVTEPKDWESPFWEIWDPQTNDWDFDFWEESPLKDKIGFSDWRDLEAFHDALDEALSLIRKEKPVPNNIWPSSLQVKSFRRATWEESEKIQKEGSLC